MQLLIIFSHQVSISIPFVVLLFLGGGNHLRRLLVSFRTPADIQNVETYEKETPKLYQIQYWIVASTTAAACCDIWYIVLQIEANAMNMTNGDYVYVCDEPYESQFFGNLTWNYPYANNKENDVSLFGGRFTN